MVVFVKVSLSVKDWKYPGKQEGGGFAVGTAVIFRHKNKKPTPKVWFHNVFTLPLAGDQRLIFINQIFQIGQRTPIQFHHVVYRPPFVVSERMIPLARAVCK